MPLLHPPAVRLVIRVGVTGHRISDLVGAGFIESQLRASIRSTLELIRDAARRLLADNLGEWAEGEPVIRIISSLAEGTDRLVAEEALVLGFDLQCVLPFQRDVYSEDFSCESVKHFTELLSRATSVLELDGCRGADAEAYQAAGRAVLRNVDLLVAVWNREPPRGKGGTGQIVAESVAVEVPTLLIDPNPPHYISLLEGLHAPYAVNIEALDARLRVIVSPDIESNSDKENTSKFLLRQFLEEDQVPWNFSFLYDLFCRLWVREWSHPTVRVSSPEHNSYMEWNADWGEVVQGSANAEGTVQKGLPSAFAWADSLANIYAGKYRSSYVSSYLMGASAILCAYLASRFTQSQSLFLVGELSLILAILFLTYWGRRQGWHERWMDYRMLAESLRHALSLSFLGQVTARFQVPAHLEAGDPRGSWFHAYFRAVVRDAGLVEARLNSTFLAAYRRALANSIKRQQGYHGVNARRQEILHRRLHRAAQVVFGATALACTLHIVPLAWENAARFAHSFGEERFRAFEDILTFCAIVLPALGGALSAISHHGEFVRVGRRSEALEKRLEVLSCQLAALSEHSNSGELGRIALEFSDVALAELIDWRFVFLEKRLDLPA